MRVFLVAWAFWLSASAVMADAGDWFTTLSADDRIAIQADLVLTGDYAGLIDGVFGPATARALITFQTKQGGNTTGALSDQQRSALSSSASAVFKTLGMSQISDTRTGLSVFLPMSLLTQQRKTPDGTRYLTKDSNLVVDMLSRSLDGATLAEILRGFLIGKAYIPARDLQVDVLIRKNSDPSLPASHLMEINFTVSDSFIGGSIAGLPGVLLKNEELVQGQPLVGASARVVGNSFLFALSATPEDSTANVNLLTSKKWMDLALIYASGKRAIITLEEDADAQALFARYFAGPPVAIAGTLNDAGLMSYIMRARSGGGT